MWVKGRHRDVVGAGKGSSPVKASVGKRQLGVLLGKGSVQPIGTGCKGQHLAKTQLKSFAPLARESHVWQAV